MLSIKTVCDLNNDGLVSDAEILQSNNYYPFGLNMEMNTNGAKGNNKYQYNAKEWNDDFGLSLNDYGVRMYDPAICRWNSIDPLSEKMRRYSPYNYGFGNPIKFFDPDGEYPYPIEIRSFAPYPTFGGGFKGDNRTYSEKPCYLNNSKEGVTSRVQQALTVDTDKGYYTDFGTWSDRSDHPLLGQDYGIPFGSISNYEVTNSSEGNKVISFSSVIAAANPLLPSADIDIKTSIKLTEDKKNNEVSIDINMTGDKFPSAEVIIGDNSGQRLIVGVSPAKGNPYTSLPGNHSRPMMNNSIRIGIDKKGVFQNVRYGGRVYTIQAWNDAQKAKPSKK